MDIQTLSRLRAWENTSLWEIISNKIKRFYIERTKMTYAEYQQKLNQNLLALMEKCDNGECSIWEVIRYRDHMTKLLNDFRKQHEKEN